MKICALILLTVASVGLATLSPEEASKKLEAANQAFDGGNYTQAAGDYRALLDSGYTSGEMHYNLGSAYFRAKALGQAIYHFRKAEALLPRDPDVKFNLSYARHRSVDKIEAKGVQIPRVLPLSLKEALYFLSFASIFFWAACAVFLFRKGAPFLWTRRVALGLFLLAGVSAGQIWWLQSPFGVVTAPEADVTSGPEKDSTLLFKLHEGTELKVGEVTGDWARISLLDGKRGWIRRESIVF